MSRTDSVLNHISDSHGFSLSHCQGYNAKFPSSTDSKSRKRSRGPLPEQELLNVPFTIYPCRHSPIARPVIAYPLLVIPRARFPLSYIDPTNVSSLLPATRLFSADIEILESQDGTGTEQPQGAYILITRLDLDECLYAAEKVQEGVYSLCRLGQWVNFGHLQAAAYITVKRPPGPQQVSHSVESEGRWWRTALLGVPRDEHRSKRRRSESSTQSDTARPRSRGLVDYTEAGAPEFQVEDRAEFPVSVPKDDSLAQALEVHAGVHDVSIHIVNQYLEALYLSKTSLAYFAKGSLSRARAALSIDRGTAAQKQELAPFLRSMILTMITMDKKYKETIPSMIKLLMPPILPAMDTSVVPAKHLKVRRGKTMKLGRNGFYSVEGTFLEKWWLDDDDSDPRSTDDSTLGNEKLSSDTKIAELRLRETLLQLILILEILAIEAPETVEITSVTKSCTKDSSTCMQDEGAKAKKPRVKRSQDLKIALDMLIDRLCIWQSVNCEEDHGIDRKSELGPGNTVPSKALATQRGSDQLKDFCRAVAIPFYATRVPDVVQELCRKLGASTGPSPSQVSASKSAKTSKQITPGTKMRRELPSTTRRPLQRVLTEVFNTWSSKPPSLGRSATDTVLLHRIKCERTETPQRNPFKDNRKPLSRSSSINQSKRLLGQREVDMSAMAKFKGVKLKKHAAVDQELKEAIATLKRPNRSNAIKDYVEAADQRAAAAVTRPHRSSALARVRSAVDVQVNATPKRTKKTTQEVAVTPHQRPSHLYVDLGDSVSACKPCVPSSSVQSLAIGHETDVARNSSRSIFERHGLPFVDETPSRGAAKHSFPLTPIGDNKIKGVVPSSHARIHHAQQLAVKMVVPHLLPRVWENNETLHKMQPRSESPPKKQPPDTPHATAGSVQAKLPDTGHSNLSLNFSSELDNSSRALNASRSIYESLGWDDNDADALIYS